MSSWQVRPGVLAVPSTSTPALPFWVTDHCKLAGLAVRQQTVRVPGLCILSLHALRSWKSNFETEINDLDSLLLLNSSDLVSLTFCDYVVSTHISICPISLSFSWTQSGAVHMYIPCTPELSLLCNRKTTSHYSFAMQNKEPRCW